jgi:hypothetical protein
LPIKKAPESDLPIELTLRIRGLQINAKGTITELSKQISSISQFAELASSKLLGSSRVITDETPATTAEESTSTEPPVIKVTNSTTENVRTLFSTPWGKTPRNLADVTNALEVNAAPDSAANIAGALLSLVKAGEFRRLRKSGMWHYFRVPSS